MKKKLISKMKKSFNNKNKSFSILKRFLNKKKDFQFWNSFPKILQKKMIDISLSNLYF